MKLVLLSGGSGRRLWPLSNGSRSKQFVKMLAREDGRLESMIQRVWQQLADTGLAGSAYVTAGKEQAESIVSQLGEGVPIIIEPERRDTFAAIALSAAYLLSLGEADPEEVVAVLPVDPCVSLDFFETVKKLETALAESGAELALIGVKPTYPSEKYGYIVPEQPIGTDRPYCRVSRFTEKPREEDAARLIEEGAVWNCGVFAFKLGYLAGLMRERGLPEDYPAMTERYSELGKISFDFEVVEKARRVVVVPYEGSWKDLGTWNTLTEEMTGFQIGKGVIGEHCSNTHLVNELDIPAAVIGLSDVVVAASPDGILIAHKSYSAKIKELTAELDQRPMYEERSWGWYKVLDETGTYPGRRSVTKRITVAAGKEWACGPLEGRTKTWAVLAGTGGSAVGGEWRPVRAGDAISIPEGVSHGLLAREELHLIEVQCGTGAFGEEEYAQAVERDRNEDGRRSGNDTIALDTIQIVS